MGALKRWVASLPALALVMAVPAHADSPVATAVKATYLVKFAHYVAWPPSSFASPAAPITLCVVGRDPFGSAIDQAAKDDRVDGRPIVVRRLATIDRNSPCQIAFIGGSIAAKTLPGIAGAPILSVTDASEAKERGLIQFDMRAGHVGFRIDDDAATRAGLMMSSRLLAIALSLTSRPTR